MENLTRSLRVAFNAPDCSPVLGHDLVIFKKVRTGLEFRDLVPTGSRFQKKLLERGEFEAFAVKRDENLHYSFSQPGEHVDLKHNYILHFTVYYSVSDPRRVIEKLESDPLQQIKRETVALIGRTARHLEWGLIVKESELERALLEHKITSEQGIVFSNLERLRQVAHDLGLTIKRITIQRSLSKEKEVARTNYEEQLDHMLSLERKERLHNEEVGNAITRVTVESIERMRDASATDDVLRMIRGLRQVEETQKLIGVQAYDSSSPTNSFQSVVTSNGPANNLLAKVLKLISELGRESAPERRLGSSMLHVVAELLLEGDAEDEVLKRYAQQLGEPFRDLYRQGRLRNDQIEVVQQLQEPPLRGQESGQGRP